MVNELFYFVPGQVILHLEHPEEMDTKELTELVSEYLESVGEPWTQLDPEHIRWITTLSTPLTHETGRTISLVSTQLMTPPDHKHGGQDDLVDLLVKLYDWIKEHGPQLIADDISLRTVSPNWLMGGSPHLPGVGGPGAWPVPAVSPTGDEWKFAVANAEDIINSSAGEGVDVAVLDTAPCLHELVMAYHDFDGHPLIESLLGPTNPLQVYPASYEDLLLMVEYSLMKHSYLMSDHGLFVAGIIRTIAPQAKIRLYEVLNPYGVGCYETIVKGLQKALSDQDPGRFLIINCSLVLSMPILIFLTNQKKYEFDHDASDYPDKFKDPFREDELTASFREVVNQFVGSGVVVVAAAGNDAKETHPSARFPAAYDNVIGVGAMPIDSLDQSSGRYRAASYSNLCDRPPFSLVAKASGYMTLGGEAGVGQGIRGVYIHDLPAHNGSTPPLTYDQIQYVHNDTGWAWWAGTSFAAPIISGLLAAAWKSNWQGTGSPHSFLSGLAGQNRSNAEERTILVKQLNP